MIIRLSQSFLPAPPAVVRAVVIASCLASGLGQLSRAQTPSPEPAVEQAAPQAAQQTPAPPTQSSEPPASPPPTTETATTETAIAPQTVASIEEQQKQAATATDLDEELKKKVDELYRQAMEQAKRAEVFSKQLVTFEATKQSAETRAAELKQRLESPAAESEPVSATESLPELERRLAEAEQQSTQLKEKLTTADNSIASRSARRKTIRDRLVEAKRQLESGPELSETASGDSTVLSTAQKTERATLRHVLQAEVAALEAELAALDAEDVVDLPRLQRDLAALELTQAEALLQQLQTAVSEKRDEEASKQIESAKEQAEQNTHPLLRTLADRNLALAEQLQSLNKLIADVELRLKESQSVRDYWTQEAEAAKKKAESIGLTDAIGAMLRKQKLSLPNPAEFKSNIRNRSELISSAHLDLLDLQDERSADLDETVRQQAESDAILTNAIRDEAEALIAKRNEMLGPLIRAQSTYFDKLVELSNTEQQVVNQVTDYEDFIDERVLWVRSSLPLLSSLRFEREDDLVLDGSRARQATESLYFDITNNPGWYVLAGIVLLVLLRNRLAFRRRIKSFGQLAQSNSCTQFWPTVATLLLTALAAVPWPALLGFLAWRFSLAAGSSEVLKALAYGFSSVAMGYLPLEFFRLTCRPEGLAESHFGWPTKSIKAVRKCIRGLMLIGLPLVMLTAILSSHSSGQGNDVFERLTFMVVTIVLALFVSRVLHHQTGAVAEYLARHPDSWLYRLRPLWYWLLVLSPLVLTGLTFFGYFYTAQQLAWRLFFTTCLLGAMLIATAFVGRLLLVQRRRLSIEQARLRRAAQAKASQDETAAVVADEVARPEDLRDQVSQSKSLLRTVMVGVALAGIWFTWIDVLPALDFLERWPLWKSTVQVTEMVTDDADVVTFTTRDVIDNVTISDVVFALLIFTVTLVAARNIPGVLEISVLQRLPIEASVRYAITTIVSYVIVLVGLVVACKFIGIRWNQVQWMATALTFGLAFGLQEMFANFVAGIIILFERPIRVGDIVTVDEVTGVVSRVRIRATTITNWDRKDYVVPNKDFITGRVLNWTLSDQFNRIVVNVGVAYGSDRDKTLENLRRVAREHPLVVDDPAPIVTFEEFGASSLSFVLRCYIAMKDMPSRLQVVHDLHSGIDDAFREAQIEIAFPQQDIHLRTMPSQETKVLPDTNGNTKQLKETASSSTPDKTDP